VSMGNLVGESPAMQRVFDVVRRAIPVTSTVLVQGESGTGKELVARHIHFAGPRKDAPFVVVNCAAIPENLVESELFGHEKGAFTGADASRPGKFEMADGGTLFLDEIGDMRVDSQAKLLRVLQDGAVERVGATHQRHVDVRVIAATNRDLEKMIREKEFREDLYYRLSVIPLRIPPLRDRREDIPLLVESMLKKYAQIINKEVEDCSPQVMAYLQEYHWPGNVRELENAVEYGVTMSLGRVMEADALPPRIKRFLQQQGEEERRSGTLQEQLREYERRIFKDVLERYGPGRENKLKMADDLGISRATFYRKLAEHRLSQE
jgi:sigma-54 dependent transcriptional regulator, acetoin dehydrogenase operon transcriptional activator AcoR